MFSISNNELEKCPDITEIILCTHCKETHEVKYGKEVLSNGSKVKSDLAYYNCGSKSYLAGIDGKSII